MHPSATPRQLPSPAPATLAGLVCLVLVTARAEAADAQVYECNEGGTVTFSQRPCGDRERKVDIQFDQPDPQQLEAAESNADARQAEAGVTAEADVLDSEIQASEQRITRLRIEREARRDEMREQQDLGTENLDQEAWVAQTNRKIESVYQEYSAQIVAETNRLDDLRARRAALENGDAGSAPPDE